jgi:N-acetylmuramoyl-L-alanine amidase
MPQYIIFYALKSVICSGIFTLYYYTVLRNRRFHYYNRFYILFCIILSIVLPMLHLEWFSIRSTSAQPITLLSIINIEGGEAYNASENTFINLQQMILFSVTAISVAMMITFYLSIARIYTLKNKYPVNKTTDFDFINTDVQQAPFSFLKNIFWRNDILLNDETGKQILQHEITHIQQKHSWDKLFMQLLLCFYWINPFFWLLKKELYLIHEFIADEKAVGKSDASAFAKMLLTSQYGKFQFLPAQSIFYSPVKRRLFMLTTSKKSQFSYVKRLMVLPLFAMVICLFAFTVNKDSGAPQNIVVTKTFKLVVDAGHGGKDLGAAGNGLYEKDVALKIAEKIKALSSAYGVDVVLTRDNDVFMSPAEKSSFANGQNADALISIHANANNKNSIESGFEVLLSPDNKFASQNQVLGSAILQNISKNFNAASALHQQQVGIWVLKNSNIPAALIECGYITNEEDAGYFKNDAKIELMAKNILQGIAMYANNSFDKSSLYQLKNEPVKDTNAPAQITIKGDNPPLFILDGKPVTEQEIGKLDPNDVESVNVLKDKTATGKYGDKGKNGVVEIVSKPNSGKTAPAALYVLNGQVVSKETVDKLDPATIEKVDVLKDKTATEKYGDKGKNGVIEITLKPA